MKIIIGPYINYIGPYQLADLLKPFGVSKIRRDDIGEFLSNTFVGDFCEWIHKHRKVKQVIRIDEYDTWSMDRTLAPIILVMLKQLKESKHGSPGDMPEFDMVSSSIHWNNQLTFPFYAEDDDKAWEAGHKRFDEIMDKMIWSFEQYSDPSAEDNLRGDEYIAHLKRLQEGFDLFGKYYTGLWD